MQKVRSWAAAVICALASVTVVSCANTSRPTYLPDGSRGYAVACRGILNTWDSCLVKAGRICGARGYNTINEDQYDRTLLFGCKSGAVSGN
jgi:hypothetical protein